MKDAQERWLQLLRDKVQTVPFSLQGSCIKVLYKYLSYTIIYNYTKLKFILLYSSWKVMEKTSLLEE